MAAVISENYLSRPFTIGGQGARELVFDVVGTDDDEEVRLLLLATAPASYLGRVLESVDAEPVGNGVWKGHARYVRPDSDDEFSFETGGGTTHITQALSTIASYAPPGLTAPDTRGAIGATKDGVDGLDIVTPVYQFSETHRFSDLFVAAGYKLVLFNLTGRTNSSPFRGLAVGECLFLGASGSKRADSDWRITYKFAGSPNQTGLAVGDITDVAKAGWDVLDITYAAYPDSVAFALVNRPIGVQVQRVYYQGDFSLLAIGA